LLLLLKIIELQNKFKDTARCDQLKTKIVIFNLQHLVVNLKQVVNKATTIIKSTMPTENSSEKGGRSSNTASNKTKSSSSSSSNTNPVVFPVGPAGKRELRRALVRSTDPGETIRAFQQSHSLHSMLARAFGTTPKHEAAKRNSKEEDNVATATATTRNDNGDESEVVVESLETDAALTFVSHLGVSQHEVHKRIADTLLKQLDVEIRKTNAEEPLLNLLKQCWGYATTIPELRPVLWTVLKQLGPRTPVAVLKALGEQQESNGDLKHADIFRPLPPLLKRLVWETDWDDKVPAELEETSDPKTFLERVNSTLLNHTIMPHLKQYTSNEYLVTQANAPFVATVRERKILTTQRRALTTVSTTTTTITTTGVAASAISKASNTLGALTKTVGGNNATSSKPSEGMTTGKSISSIRQLLSDATGGTTAFRPKLLHAVLSILISEHGSMDDNLLGCADHLHCTLAADLLLSATGLPKTYQQVSRLATVLDDSVKVGILTDPSIVKIQACLKEIFPPDEDEAKKDKKPQDKRRDETVIGKKANDPIHEPTTAFKRQLSRIIKASLTAMKEADPENLFLNPVTDAIAPGYSKIIPKPMCIVNMEEKIDDQEYLTLKDWENDVNLMYQNCITYNKGPAGQWFRGEAQRQKNVFKDEVLPQARELYDKEVSLRTQRAFGEDLSKKRKYPGAALDPNAPVPAASQVVPLPAVIKGATKTDTKEKKDTDSTKSNQAYPSMPALASMLLADPFVVRLLLDRVLRSLRLDITRGKSLPTSHNIVPSLLQLLHMAQWSNKVCAIRGKQYIVPDAGTIAPQAEAQSSTEEYLMRVMPFESLRKYLPLLSQLLLENELDKRVVVSGDLYEASNFMEQSRPGPPPQEAWKSTVNDQAIVSLVEAALVHICRPGNGNEVSLAITYPKFATALLSSSSFICDDRAFFLCLIQSLLKHKSKLQRSTRDVVVANWLDFLRTPPRHSKRKKGHKKMKKWGTMTSAAHECLMLLLNEWASLGNQLLPRDLLLKLSADAIEAANESETLAERTFVAMWNDADKAEGKLAGTGHFGMVRKQYERMLEGLPENFRTQWREQVGLKEQQDENMNDAAGKAVGADYNAADADEEISEMKQIANAKNELEANAKLESDVKMEASN